MSGLAIEPGAHGHLRFGDQGGWPGFLDRLATVAVKQRLSRGQPTTICGRRSATRRGEGLSTCWSATMR